MKLSVDDELATCFLADPIFELRLENAQISRPQPDQCERQQRGKRDRRPEGDCSYFH